MNNIAVFPKDEFKVYIFQNALSATNIYILATGGDDAKSIEVLLYDTSGKLVFSRITGPENPVVSFDLPELKKTSAALVGKKRR